jgi:hypothetical protein
MGLINICILIGGYNCVLKKQLKGDYMSPEEELYTGDKDAGQKDKDSSGGRGSISGINFAITQSFCWAQSQALDDILARRISQRKEVEGEQKGEQVEEEQSQIALSLCR